LNCYKGDITGSFDFATASGVKAFQSAKEQPPFAFVTVRTISGANMGAVDFLTWNDLIESPLYNTLRCKD